MLPPARALIIEDDKDYEILLKNALTDCQGGFDVRTAHTLAEALPMLQQFKSDVILLDLNLPDSTGYSTFLRVRDDAGEAPVIVLTSVDEDQLAIQAVEDGAQDYLVKTMIQPGLVPRYLRMALGRQNHASTRQKVTKAGLVLGFIGSKGGVGTSTVAVNVAALLAQSGSDTTFLELHCGPGASSLYMQTEPAHDLSWVMEAPAEEITPAGLQQCAIEPVLGLRLIRTHSSPGTRHAIGADYALAITSAARRICTHLVLDLPARLDEGIAAALDVCNTICMVVDREPASVHCAVALLRQIEAQKLHTADVNIVEIDRTRLEDRFPAADFRSQLQREPLVTLRAAAASICASHSARIPLVSLYPEDAFSLGIRDLTERLLAPFAQGAQWAEPYRRISRPKSYWRTIPETAYS